MPRRPYKSDCEDCNEWIDAIKRVIDEIKKLEDEAVINQDEMPSYNGGKISGLRISRHLLEELFE